MAKYIERLKEKVKIKKFDSNHFEYSWICGLFLLKGKSYTTR